MTVVVVVVEEEEVERGVRREKEEVGSNAETAGQKLNEL